MVRGIGQPKRMQIASPLCIAPEAIPPFLGLEEVTAGTVVNKDSECPVRAVTVPPSGAFVLSCWFCPPRSGDHFLEDEVKNLRL
jgi:hypothetical protein